MKRTLLFACILCTLLGCNSYSGSPKEALSNFLNAMHNSNYAEAKKYATDESQGFIDMISLNGNESSNVYKDKTYDIGNINISGNDAKAEVNFPPNTSIAFHLKNQHGAWKVNFNMGAILEMAKDVLKKEGLDIQKDIDKAIDSIKIDKGDDDKDDKDDKDTAQ